jgi:hypothetical protein
MAYPTIMKIASVDNPTGYSGMGVAEVTVRETPTVPASGSPDVTTTQYEPGVREAVLTVCVGKLPSECTVNDVTGPVLV